MFLIYIYIFKSLCSQASMLLRFYSLVWHSIPTGVTETYYSFLKGPTLTLSTSFSGGPSSLLSEKREATEHELKHPDVLTMPLSRPSPSRMIFETVGLPCFLPSSYRSWFGNRPWDTYRFPPASGLAPAPPACKNRYNLSSSQAKRGTMAPHNKEPSGPKCQRCGGCATCTHPMDHLPSTLPFPVIWLPLTPNATQTYLSQVSADNKTPRIQWAFFTSNILEFCRILKWWPDSSFESYSHLTFRESRPAHPLFSLALFSSPHIFQGLKNSYKDHRNRYK